MKVLISNTLLRCLFINTVVNLHEAKDIRKEKKKT